MLEDFITKVLIAIAVTAFLGYLSSAARGYRAARNIATGELTLTYVRPYKILAVVSLILPADFGALALYLYRSGETAYFGFVVMSLVFGAMSVYSLLECFVVRLVVSEEAITSISPWSGRRVFKWNEVDWIKYSKMSQWYVIAGPGGKKIRASEYLAGIREMVSELRTRIPSEKWLNLSSVDLDVRSQR